MNPMHVSKESLFVSAVRSFFNTFFALLGIVACVLLVGLGVTLIVGFSSDSEKTAFSIQPDANGQRSPLPFSTPALLKVDIDGVIGNGKLVSSAIENILLNSREGVLKNNRVKGVLLCINTPGGTVTDSNGIYELFKAYKEKYNVPVFAYIDGLCASGGMYVASSADKIYASSVSIIGSVGVVFGPVFNFYGLMEKWGIKATTIAKGKDKAMLNPFAPLVPGEDESLDRISEHLYHHFVDLVVAARSKISKEDLVNIYGAQVYVAPKAQEIGFIDVAGATYSQTVAALAEAAGIKTDEKYQVIECKVQRPFLSEMLDANSLFAPLLKLLHRTDPLGDLSSINDPYLYLYRPTLP